MAIGLLFFSAIELSEYRISYWRIQETIGLSDIGSRPQSIGISDIGLRKNYRRLDSARLTKKKKKRKLLLSRRLNAYSVQCRLCSLLLWRLPYGATDQLRSETVDVFQTRRLQSESALYIILAPSHFCSRQ
jgi:hypothetical protein